MQGLILINKPIGYTSQAVVSKLKKILNVKKAGHTGTLDPMATGILPILIGDYTKISKYLIEHDKTYVAKLKMGIKTDTGDKEGNIVEHQDVPKFIDKNIIIEKLMNLNGKTIEQTPPIYSAIKVNGKKLYEYAREGKKVEIPKRMITIYEISFIDYNSETDEIKFMVSCSKGTYIRVLCEDIAKSLGTIGHMSSLNRVVVDKFKIEDAISLDELENNRDNQEFISSKLIKMKDIFNDLKRINLDNRKVELFLNGVNLTQNYDDGLYNIYNKDENIYIGTGTVKNKLLKRDIVICEN